MTDTDLLAPFAVDVIRAVAEDNGIELTELQEALMDHQQTMRDTPGVEDLVYEWRKQYDDPILRRTESTFVVAVPPTVWEEYGEYLDFGDTLLAAVTAVHQEQSVRNPAIPFEELPAGNTVLIAVRE